MSPALLVDVVLVLLLVVYLFSGWRRGAVLGVLSILGLVVGAVVGIALVPGLAAEMAPGPAQTLTVLGAIVLLAAIGQALGAVVGARARKSLRGTHFRGPDKALGALMAVLAAAVVLSVLVGAARGAPVPALSRAVGASVVAQTLDRVLPEPFTGAADAVARSVAADFPRVFAGVGPEIILPVDPPSPDDVGTVAADAAGSTVKILGTARACGSSQAGSGFVLAGERVVTNAHVVAGVDAPTVQVLGQGPALAATVVVFDADRDLAVLAVPGLDAPALAVGQELERGDPATVLGYPLNGPFTSSPARVRQVLQARGEDIYAGAEVEREVYSLHVRVRPGSSGGPVLDAGGAVVGVVFAASLDDPDTGYALTAAEAAPVFAAAAAATASVDVGPCSGR